MATLTSPGISVTVIDTDEWLPVNCYYTVGELNNRNNEKWYLIWAGEDIRNWISINFDRDQYWSIGNGDVEVSESLLVILKLTFPQADRE